MNAPNSVLPAGFGPVHRSWLLHPFASALAALFWFLLVAIYALALGVGFDFETTNGRTIAGFFRTQWLVFLLANPLAALMMGFYFRVLDNVLLSMDGVLRPSTEKGKAFSAMVADRFAVAWRIWIFPTSLFAPILLTLVADFRDILAPLQLPALGIHEIDWSTQGYLATDAAHPLWYLGFNIAAFSLQVFLAYCGCLLLLLTTYLLGLAIGYGICGRELFEIFAKRGREESRDYEVEWDFKDPSGRCGLHRLDQCYVLYVVLNLASLGVAILSVLYNQYVKGAVDVGSLILVIANVFFVPVCFLWVLLPYYTCFPRQLPQKLRNSGLPEPCPWPFKSEKLTWLTLSVGAAAWLYLASKIITLIESAFTQS